MVVFMEADTCASSYLKLLSEKSICVIGSMTNAQMKTFLKIVAWSLGFVEHL